MFLATLLAYFLQLYLINAETFNCLTSSSCQGQTLTCTSTPCEFNCLARSACRSSTLNCLNNNDCTINLGGGNAAGRLSTINCPNNGDCTITGTATNNGFRDATLNCGDSGNCYFLFTNNANNFHYATFNAIDSNYLQIKKYGQYTNNQASSVSSTINCPSNNNCDIECDGSDRACDKLDIYSLNGFNDVTIVNNEAPSPGVDATLYCGDLFQYSCNIDTDTFQQCDTYPDACDITSTPETTVSNEEPSTTTIIEPTQTISGSISVCSPSELTIFGQNCYYPLGTLSDTNEIYLSSFNYFDKDVYMAGVQTNPSTNALSSLLSSTKVNTDSTAGYESIASFKNTNKILVSWIDDDDSHIYSRIYDTSSTSWDASPFTIDSSSRSSIAKGYGISSTSLSNGNVVITWYDYEYSSGTINDATIRATVYDSNGNEIVSPYTVKWITGSTSGLQIYPFPVTSSIDGYYLIAWYDNDDVQGRVYANSGTDESGVFTVDNSRNFGHTAYSAYRLRIINNDFTGWSDDDLFIIKYVCDGTTDPCIGVYDKDGNVRTIDGNNYYSVSNANVGSFGIAGNCKGLFLEYRGSVSNEFYGKLIEFSESYDSNTGISSFAVIETEDILITDNYNVQYYAEVTSFDSSNLLASYHDNTIYDWSCYAQQLCIQC